MVGGVPAEFALRDLFYAAGLGFLLCVAYSAARLLLGSGKTVCFVCDAAVLALGAAGESEILDPGVVSISYPGFFDTLRQIGG